jgi:hypothetical protein
MLALWAKAGTIKPSKKANTNAALRMINSSPLLILDADASYRWPRQSTVAVMVAL